MQSATPNALIHETSPYLLQHAYNPVEWHAWNNSALEKAVKEDKLLLISIGYSACHWCHVMEHESFEDDEVADLMNKFFVCIKVDREERPDIDQVYMTAVQLMTGHGGWPLNCFALPDGRPVYGGTYFQKEQWKNVLLNLAEIYKTEKERLLEYADQLTKGIRNYELIPASTDEAVFESSLLNVAVEKWKPDFDKTEGGPNRAPKFPMPNNYLFFLKYFQTTADKDVERHIKLTLKKMAYGGIYDQAGGGFARYSVDAFWKVPHFEKMLYDNGQLISLYAEAYRLYKDELYKDIIEDTLNFTLRELTGKSDNFYSALDADSEGEEGLFYTWTKKELMEILKDDFPLFLTYYNVNETGYWEHGRYILLRKENDDVIAQKFNLQPAELKSKVKSFKQLLMSEREKRIRPGLDDKSLTSWNALMCFGFIDAYHAMDEPKFLNAAERNVAFIKQNLLRSDGGINRNFKNGITSINGYLDDYVFIIQALIKLYQATFSIEWLTLAKSLMEYSIEHFSDDEQCFFYYTSDVDPPLVARKMEIHDNVIPASNSQAAINLFLLGHYFEDEKFIARSQRMAISMKKYITAYGSSYSNWLILWLYHSKPLMELSICGENALSVKQEIIQSALPPELIVGGSLVTETIPMTYGRLQPGKTAIYLCINKSCKLPVYSVDELRKLLS
jgi:uncharacterized protein